MIIAAPVRGATAIEIVPRAKSGLKKLTGRFQDRFRLFDRREGSLSLRCRLPASPRCLSRQSGVPVEHSPKSFVLQASTNENLIFSSLPSQKFPGGSTIFFRGSRRPNALHLQNVFPLRRL
jgi:hypothetical protein